MKKNKNLETINHCCDLMTNLLHEKEPVVFYNPIYREYFISLRSEREGKLGIYNCPWCGCEFPRSLVDEYYAVLLKEFSVYREPYAGNYFKMVIKDDWCQDELFELPKEFKSDEWWKKRKL